MSWYCIWNCNRSNLSKYNICLSSFKLILFPSRLDQKLETPHWNRTACLDCDFQKKRIFVESNYHLHKVGNIQFNQIFVPEIFAESICGGDFILGSVQGHLLFHHLKGKVGFCLEMPPTKREKIEV